MKADETFGLGEYGDTFLERGSVAKSIKISGTAGGTGFQIYSGDSGTRDDIRAEVGTAGGIGSLYCSTTGELFFKVANEDATTDWELVTTTAADAKPA